MGTIVDTSKSIVLANPCKMLMPKATRVQIYEHLFREGVMVAKKDFHLAKHPEVPVPNLHVIKALQSLKSRGLVTEQFAWRHYYWYLSNEGIQYLRDFLHLPPEIVPSTLKRQTRPEPARQDQRCQRVVLALLLVKVVLRTDAVMRRQRRRQMLGQVQTLTSSSELVMDVGGAAHSRRSD